jgi:chloride channel 7
MLTMRFADDGRKVEAYFALLGIACSYTFIASCCVVFGAATAAGSGIPEIKTFLNGVQLREILRLRTLVCKTTGLLFSVSGGEFVERMTLLQRLFRVLC